MKNTLSTTLGVSLLTASLLLTSSMSAKADTLVIDLSDQTNSNTQEYPAVRVMLDDTTNPGAITVKVDVIPGSTGYIGDLRGVYFTLPETSDLVINPIAGGPLTATATNGDFGIFGRGADLQGLSQTFNVGVEIGNLSMQGGDDYQTTTFMISGPNLNLNAFTSQNVGVRLMSVGSPAGSRDLSSKTLGIAPSIITVSNPPVLPPIDPIASEDPVSVPEPATLTGLGLVAAALGVSRYRKAKKRA